MFKAPGIHSSWQFYLIAFVKAKLNFLAVHCHMVPRWLYSIVPVAVNGQKGPNRIHILDSGIDSTRRPCSNKLHRWYSEHKKTLSEKVLGEMYFPWKFNFRSRVPYLYSICKTLLVITYYNNLISYLMKQFSHNFSHDPLTISQLLRWIQPQWWSV